MIMIQVIGNQITRTMVAVSCDHAIAFCDFLCQPLTSKVNGEAGREGCVILLLVAPVSIVCVSSHLQQQPPQSGYACTGLQQPFIYHTTLGSSHSCSGSGDASLRQLFSCLPVLQSTLGWVWQQLACPLILWSTDPASDTLAVHHSSPIPVTRDLQFPPDFPVDFAYRKL